MENENINDTKVENGNVDSNENINITKVINENADSIEIGIPGKSGCIKLYGNFNNKEEFQTKIDKAIEVRNYTNAKISINI